MTKHSKKRKKVKSLKFIITLTIVTTIIVMCFSLSKYESTVAGNDTIRAAVPIITMSSDVLELKLSPVNNEQDYIFKVSNYDGQAKAEISMEYNLQIKTLNNLPLDFELYTYDEQNKTKVGKNLLTGNVTENVNMNVNEQVTHTYLLKIKWRESENNYLFSQEIDYVQIILNSTQVD